MHETRLKFTVNIDADEATLHNIQHRLSGSTDKLAGKVKEMLVALGIPNNFEVELRCSEIFIPYKGRTGLSEEAWGDMETPSDLFAPNWDFATDWKLRTMKYQDELIG